MSFMRVMAILAIVVTAGTLVVWAGTGRHYYTKFQVVERVEVEIDPDDPFAAAGFYDDDEGGNSNIETRTVNSFHLGLLPTPSGLFDKHMLSVLSLSVPFWVMAIGALVFSLLVARRNNGPSSNTE